MIYLPTDCFAAQILNSRSNIVTGNPYYYITGAAFSMWPASAPATTFQVVLADSVYGNIFVGIISSASTQTGVMEIQTPPGFFFKNKSANSQLNFILNTPIVGGGLAVNIYYGLASL